MAPRRRRRTGRRRGTRRTGSFWGTVKSLAKKGFSALGNAFMKDPVKYINGAKNLYNQFKASKTSGLPGRRKRGRGGRRRDAGLWERIGHQTGGVLIVAPARRRGPLRRAAIRRALRR